MAYASTEKQPWRCPSRRMPSGVRLFGIPVCAICRDPVQDCVWASGIQAAPVGVGIRGGMQFLAEELLLGGALALVEHRLPSIFDRFIEGA